MSKQKAEIAIHGYDSLLGSIVEAIQQARRTAARSVNAIMTATYWEIGRRIVEEEQDGQARAEYGEGLLTRLSEDLTSRFGRGFSQDNLENMRRFYLTYGSTEIAETLSRRSKVEISETASRISPETSLSLEIVASRFPLPWSAYVRLLPLRSSEAREFYEEEALRGGWSVRQLHRQIESQFYERTALSRNRTTVLEKGAEPIPSDVLSPEDQIKDPYILEFLDLKDEYSESDLEEALLDHLEHFLLELGGDFAFIGRQRRLRIGDEWYRVDLLFFHRRLRCLVVIDLKTGRFTHADAGQMHMYLNYAREHWTLPDENPPVGLILCAQKNNALAKYALEGLPNKVLAAEYRTALPDESLIAEELKRTRILLEEREE